MDTCFRLGSYWIPKLLPKIIVMLKPDKHRVDLIYDNNADTLGPWSTEFLRKPSTYFNRWLSAEENADFNTLKNEIAITHIAQTYNIPLIILDVVDDFKYQPDDKARDVSHPGPDANRVFAGQVLDKIKSAGLM